MFARPPKPLRHVLVARVDAMGDVILALPLCGLIKQSFPDCRVTFLGRSYTRSIANACEHIDDFINRDDWNTQPETAVIADLKKRNFDTVLHLHPAKEVLKMCARAGIRQRVGGMSKISYLLYCNRIMFYGRKKSRLSEAELNNKMSRAVGIRSLPARSEVSEYYGFTKIPELDAHLQSLLDSKRINLIIHPLSNKNAKEWGLHNYTQVINNLDRDRFKIFITGSAEEKAVLMPWVSEFNHNVIDMSGKLSLDQLISFINASDGLIASSTGPLHVAAACGIHALGLYEDRWAKRGERWGPLGVNADFIQCTNADMNTISAEMVLEKVQQWSKIR